MKKPLAKTRILLIGGSLTHLCFLSKLSVREMERLKIILVNPFPSLYYPEMAAGYLEGIFSEKDVQIDISTLCERKGVHLIIAQPVKIDTENKEVALEDGRRITYDILSLNLEPFGRYAEGLSYYGITIYFHDNLQKLKQHFLKKSIESNITIVGGGKLGVEIALALFCLGERHHRSLNITLIEEAQTLLPGFDIKVKKMVQNRLKERRVDLLLGRTVTRVTGDFLVFNDHSVLEYGFLIWTTVATDYPILEGSGLKMDERGRVIVEADLRAQGEKMVFACGESTLIQGANQLFHSMDPWREAEMLLRNILKTINNIPLIQYIQSSTNRGNIYLGGKKAITQKKNSFSMGFLDWHFRKSHDRKLIGKIRKAKILPK